MTRIVVDASALAALVFAEPEGEAVARRLEGAALFAPTLLRFELANTAWKKCRRQPHDSATNAPGARRPSPLISCALCSI